MKEILVFPAGTGEAVSCAADLLSKNSIRLVYHPTPEVTHLLLDVPTKELPADLLERLPETICVVGGNLTQPMLDGYKKMDLLQMEPYLAQNAAVTAECALQVAAVNSKRTLSGSSVLVIGWGRIGKCLADLLKRIGCRVTVLARKPADQAVLTALGYETGGKQFDIILNTVPAPVLGDSAYPDALKIDLASQRGLKGENVIWARGLPGLYAPETSGKLIAETFLKEVTP